MKKAILSLTGICVFGAAVLFYLAHKRKADAEVPAVRVAQAASQEPVTSQPSTVATDISIIRQTATDSLYSISAKDQGLPFDLVATETKREPTKSYLSVPGFHKRSAAGSRWLMCVYTDLAIKRGFKYWTTVYPDDSSETIVVGFYHSADANIPEALGKDYVASRAMPDRPTNVDVIGPKLCGMQKSVVKEGQGDTGKTVPSPASTSSNNIAQCAVYARAMADSSSKDEWLANANKIKAECPGKGFECTTYKNSPEKNKCEPFEWDGGPTFFKDIKHGFPINHQPPGRRF